MRVKKGFASNGWRQFLKAGLVALAFLMAEAHAQQPEPLLQQADAALQKEDYAGAVQALETYLTLQPDDYRAEFNLAYAVSLLGRRAEAIRRYRNVLSREKDLAPAHLNLGILLLEDGNAAEAAEHLRVVVEQQPNNAKASFPLAQALSALHRTEEARALYERLLSLQPDNAPAHLALGKLLAETDPAVAEKHLRRAIELDPSLEEARLLLATVLETRAAQGADTLEEAATIYRQTLDTHPQRHDIRVRLGQVYTQQKRFSEAAKQWEMVRAAGDASPELAQALLQVYLQSPGGEKEKALPVVQEILAQDPGNPELWLLAGRLWMEKKQYREAAQRFRRVTELRPEWAPGYTNLASALYLLKDYEGTVAALAKVGQLRQDTPGTYFLRAISLDKLHQRQQAVENYQRFLETDGEKNPDQQFQARQRLRILSRELQKGYK
ncbi:MAG: tetratricopeptide repeat protein [Acidobacteria bacterium]|nr:tetratricopeptide repeat protein [Acidobacteriota bacterium]